MTTKTQANEISSDRLFPLYFLHLARLLRRIKSRSEELFEIGRRFIPEPDATVQYVLGGDPKITDLVDSILLDSARLNQLLYSPNDRYRKSDKKEVKKYQFRKARALAIRNALGGIEPKTLRESAARNALAHFDERLDDLILDRNSSKLANYGAAPCQMVLSHSKAMEGGYHMGVYVSAEKEYHVDGAVISLLAVYEEVCELLKRYENSPYYWEADHPVLAPL